MCSPSWTHVCVRVDRETAEAVANFLMEMGSPGLEMTEGEDETLLQGYFQGEPRARCEQIRSYLRDLESMGLTVGLTNLEVSPLEEEDWLSSWRSRFAPLPVGRRLLIRPSWAVDVREIGRLVIVIDPQMAFGTGEHATTSFCLRALEDLVRPEDLILDVGAGSGILSIAAAKLGAKRLLGLEIDPQAIVTARKNVRLNGVSNRVDISNIAMDRLDGDRFHIVVANINGSTLLPLLPELNRVARHGGHIVLAGFLAEEESVLRRALYENGLSLSRIEHQEEWIGAVVRAREMR